MLFPDLEDVSQAIIGLVWPVPPSANSLYRNVPGKGRVKSAPYKRWLAEAEAGVWEHFSQLGGRRQMIEGPYCLRMVVEFPNNRRRDLDNVVKATSDALVRFGLVSDDSMMRRLEVERAPLPGKTVRISIISTR